MRLSITSEDSVGVVEAVDVVSCFLCAGIVLSFLRFEGIVLRKQSMPVLSSQILPLEQPALYTKLGMLSSNSSISTHTIGFWLKPREKPA